MRTECNERDCGPLTLTIKCIVEVDYCKFRNYIKFSKFVAMIPCEERFISGMAFSIFVRVPCQSRSGA